MTLARPRLHSSLHVSAGIVPEPGQTSTLPAWWGRADWVELEVRDAVDAHRDVCRQHHVDPDTVVAVARGMADYADDTTGRDCRPTNERLVERVRVSLSTVQRARRVLKALGLVVELIRGRSVMTRSERLAAWRRGSKHRAVAAVFALCSRRERPAGTARKTKIKRRRRRQPVERDTPTSSYRADTFSPDSSTHLERKAETSEEERAPRAAPKDRSSKRAGHDPAAVRLAERARRRLGWLAGVSARRITPTLSRFALAGWSDRDVERAVADAMAARGWRLPRQLAQPAAYLATLLREVDPADRPGAWDEHMAAVDAAQAAYERRLIWGAPCEHGQPAGDEPSPLLGHRACPSCRAAQR